MAGRVVALRAQQVSLGDAMLRFLSERDLSAGTRRVYGITFDQLAAVCGPDVPLAGVTAADLQAHLVARYASATAVTYNRNRSAIQSLFGWATRQGLIAEDPARMLEARKVRRTERQAALSHAVDRRDLEALWARTDVALRDKTLWRLLYETGARANEALGIDIEHTDLADRSARIVGKGGGAARIFWATGTRGLLPRLIAGRTTGPLFLTERRSRQAVARDDLDDASGRARLSYRRAAEIFTESTGGLTLHQLRHAQLTHLAEEGVDVALLKAKSRHESLRSLERYVRPSDASVAKLTADHDPARRGRRR